MAQLKWSLRSRDDLYEIESYVSRDSVVYAERLVDSIIDAAEKTVTNPQIGRTLPEMQNDTIRELIFRHYRIIYTLSQSNQVTVLRVLHSARNIETESLF